MNEPRLQTHKVASEYEQKFDYWVASLTGAVLAYFVQHYVRRFDSVASCVEPVALLFFVISFWYSYRRIECEVKIAKMNHALFEARNEIDSARAGLQKHPGLPLDDTATGTPFTPDELQQHIAKEQAKNRITLDRMRDCQSESERAYSRRFVFLVLGFISLIASKVILPSLQ